jgi:hypothetical protein
MKFMLSVLLLVVSMLMSFEGHARATVPIQSPQQADFAIGGDKVLSLETVRSSIGVAASNRDWQVVTEAPGKVQLRNVVRNKHVLVVNVLYNTKGVRIEYVSSENLKYEMHDGTAFIHPKYNEWVGLLLKDIVAKVGS